MTSVTAPEQQRSIMLPVGLATNTDLSRIIRELEEVDSFLRQSAIRQPGSPMQLPKTSKVFEELVSRSKLNMLLEDDRQYLHHSLDWMREKSPVLHVAFSAEPSPVFMERLITWLRQQVSPFLLVRVGLHPNIGAGCVVRSTNKQFDFSLRQRFEKQRPLLLEQLGIVRTAEPEAAAPAPAPEPVAPAATSTAPPAPVVTAAPAPAAVEAPDSTAPAVPEELVAAVQAVTETAPEAPVATATTAPVVSTENTVALDSGVLLSTDPDDGTKDQPK